MSTQAIGYKHEFLVKLTKMVGTEFLEIRVMAAKKRKVTKKKRKEPANPPKAPLPKKKLPPPKKVKPKRIGKAAKRLS